MRSVDPLCQEVAPVVMQAMGEYLPPHIMLQLPAFNIGSANFSGQVIRLNRRSKFLMISLDAKHLATARSFYLSMKDALPIASSIDLHGHEWLKMSTNCKNLFMRHGTKKGTVATKRFT